MVTRKTSGCCTFLVDTWAWTGDRDAARQHRISVRRAIATQPSTVSSAFSDIGTLTSQISELKKTVNNVGC
jgi:hypothetical protein